MGFRDPGKVQFIAMLEHYENGKPRALGPRYVFPSRFLPGDFKPSNHSKLLELWQEHRQIWRAIESFSTALAAEPTINPPSTVTRNVKGGIGQSTRAVSVPSHLSQVSLSRPSSG
jgi:hypothetical protein